MPTWIAINAKPQRPPHHSNNYSLTFPSKTLIIFLARSLSACHFVRTDNLSPVNQHAKGVFSLAFFLCFIMHTFGLFIRKKIVGVEQLSRCFSWEFSSLRRGKRKQSIEWEIWIILTNKVLREFLHKFWNWWAGLRMPSLLKLSREFREWRREDKRHDMTPPSPQNLNSTETFRSNNLNRLAKLIPLQNSQKASFSANSINKISIDLNLFQ